MKLFGWIHDYDVRITTLVWADESGLAKYFQRVTFRALKSGVEMDRLKEEARRTLLDRAIDSL